MRINDRGPFARGRIIDVSQRGAELLGFRNRGTAKVLVEIIEAESRRLADAALSGQAAASAPKAVPMVAVTAEPLDGNQPSGAVQGPASKQTALAVSTRTDVPFDTGDNNGHVVVSRPVGGADIYVQAGSFTNFDNANRLRARLSALGDVRIAKALVEDTEFFRVRLGPVASVAAADRLLNLLLDNGHYEASVVID